MSESMRAIVIPTFGGPEVLEYRDVPRPVPGPGEVLIRVHAFGVNYAEMHMRKGEWDEWNPITGLECVGTIVSSSAYPHPHPYHHHPSPSSSRNHEFRPGTKVAAVMGGMGRTRPGSYGEYVAVPATNVISLEDEPETKLSWAQLAALPETYCTAWSCLFTVLDLRKGETLLIRGATSTLGQAALHLAVDVGAIVTATTRREERFDVLRSMGAVRVVREQASLLDEEDKIEQEQEHGSHGDGRKERMKFDKTLNLIGNSVLLESIALTRPGGRMLQAGWLGGLEPLHEFNPDGADGVGRAFQSVP
ncbi:chaperonin 10-like protein [Poronia punctata]|nr:chaperonin 10-like protein [Poronia punctata]